MIFFSLTLACTDPNGTIIGNPGDGKGKIAESNNVELWDAEVVAPQIILYQGETETVIDLDFDGNNLFDIFDEDSTFEIPVGKWDSMEVLLPELHLIGAIQDLGMENPFNFTLFDIIFSLNGQNDFSTSEQYYILEVGKPNWLDKEKIENIILEEDTADDHKSEFEDIAIIHSALYLDLDRNWEINSEDRAVPVAYTEEVKEELQLPETNETDDDNESDTVSSGCSDTSVKIMFFPFLLFPFLRRKED